MPVSNLLLNQSGVRIDDEKGSCFPFVISQLELYGKAIETMAGVRLFIPFAATMIPFGIFAKPPGQR